ncbi:GntR family transcriptional regulator [Sedimentibacter sp. zth1]|uniref:GntR family transcriptional regulator n=1 Tax=Sedimentibacter sp. zth1 TaxID=2816908 RepID=UPI001A938722|nr:GntR family transcriptional regulator [Sedimentibacter sp. zth1]QSX05707.1 GntR family transcriptional regulator [Sedimentibacter sp. zth1]
MKNKVFEKKSSDLLVNNAYKKMEEMIVTAELKPGDIVSENELSEFLGIGRTPVREALKKLEATHTIEILPRKGILIRLVYVDELLQQMEPRKALEILVVQRAAKYAFPEERKRLLELATEYRKITEEWAPAVEALRIDDEFNHLICKASKNPFIGEMLLPQHALARRQYYLNYFIDKELTANVNLSHVKLMEAIAEGDGEKAVIELEELFVNLRKFNTISLSTWLPLNEN